MKVTPLFSPFQGEMTGCDVLAQSCRECICAILKMIEMNVDLTKFELAVKFQDAFLIIIKPPQHHLPDDNYIGLTVK